VVGPSTKLCVILYRSPMTTFVPVVQLPVEVFLALAVEAVPMMMDIASVPLKRAAEIPCIRYRVTFAALPLPVVGL